MAERVLSQTLVWAMLRHARRCEAIADKLVDRAMRQSNHEFARLCYAEARAHQNASDCYRRAVVRECHRVQLNGGTCLCGSCPA